jgi:alanyl-tRNA synthetase
MMTAHDIRNRFLTFFEKRGHSILPSASLVPENDPSVLFNTAGMQPLVPYLLGEKHPQGTRLANAQKCVRTVDIDEIGDNTHATFFEMLGNWSLGDYFKEEAIHWSYEFLTSKEEGLGLDPQRLYVTVFEGDDNAPRDDEAYAIWKKIFEENNITGERIYFLGAKSNWWSAGDNGPCGPDTEMFYDVTGKLTEGLTKEAYLAADDRQEVVEIWNDVFMEFEKKDGQVVGKLANKSVDTGSGLERVAMVVQGKNNIFETDIFVDVIAAIRRIRNNTRSTAIKQILNNASQQKRDIARERVIADHLRTSFFLISDGVLPSNKDQGYVLRKLMRRTMLEEGIREIAPLVFNLFKKKYAETYPNFAMDNVANVYFEELVKFEHSAQQGIREVNAKYRKKGRVMHEVISGKDAFYFFSTFGIPKEMFLDSIDDLLDGPMIELDTHFFDDYEKEFKNHQDLSRAGSAGKFKGGMADHGEMSVKYHTTTHLLQQALRQVLGDHVMQKGSNITAERLRFDFSNPSKMTEEEIRRAESIVNDKIHEALPVSYQDLPLAEAKKLGAIGLFGEKYGETVRVYKVGDFSLEFCGGPHVTNTSELGTFKITKEEASSAGVRRIKAVLL